MLVWFGEDRYMTMHPDPDPGIPLSPNRRTVEHDLAAGGRVVDVIGRPRREYSLKWTGLTPAEAGAIEQYADGSKGPGPFRLLLDGAPGWNLLPAVAAATGSLTGDASGWVAESPTTLTTVDRYAVYIPRGPRALKWTVPVEATTTRHLSAVWPGDYPQLGTGAPITFAVNARALTGSASVFAGINVFPGAVTGPDTTIDDTGWTELSVTATPPAGALGDVEFGKRPGTAAEVVLDSPRLTFGATAPAWTPGRGVPRVVITDVSVVARWADLYDVALAVREVD